VPLGPPYGLGDPSPSSPSRPPPVGRAFDTRRTQKGRGLILAGQAALQPPIPSIHSRDSTEPPEAPPEASHDSLDMEDDYAQWKYPPRVKEKQDSGSSAILLSQEEPSAVSSAVMAWSQKISEHTQESTNEKDTDENQPPVNAGALFEEGRLLPLYQLPKRPDGLYKRQVDPFTCARPVDIVTDVRKQQEPMLQPPFERSLRRLRPEIRPPANGPSPSLGPFNKPHEPVWTEMGRRLQTILQKQARRADRKQRRTLRAKQRGGRTLRQAPRAGAGRRLREFLDSAAADAEEPSRDSAVVRPTYLPPPQAPAVSVR